MISVLLFLGSFLPSGVVPQDMVADSWRPEPTKVLDDPVPLCTAVDRVVGRTAHVVHVADAYVRGLCACARPRDQNPEAAYQAHPSS